MVYKTYDDISVEFTIWKQVLFNCRIWILISQRVIKLFRVLIRSKASQHLNAAEDNICRLFRSFPSSPNIFYILFNVLRTYCAFMIYEHKYKTDKDQCCRVYFVSKIPLLPELLTLICIGWSIPLVIGYGIFVIKINYSTRSYDLRSVAYLLGRGGGI